MRSPATARRPRPRRSVHRRHAAVIGGLSAGAALATGELTLAVLGSPISLVTAVGSAFVDAFAATLKDIAVRLFGTNDKIALVIGIVITSIAIGTALGCASRRWLASLPLGIATFGVVGTVAVATDAQGRLRDALAAGVSAVAAGVLAFGALWALAARIPRATEPIATVGERTTPDAPVAATSPAVDRRRFLTAAGGVIAGTAGATVLARRVRDGDSVAAARRTVVLPRPVTASRMPTSQPFDVPGLTPLVTPSSDFYRIDTALLTPQVDAAGWRLDITGLVGRPSSIRYDELLALDSVELPVTLQCVSNEVGGDLVGTAVWQGVTLRSLLERVDVRPDASQIVGRSVDGFTAGFPLRAAFDGRTALVAFAMNGEPLPAAHGFPARLVVAGLYGYVSATKWLSEIELTTWDAFDGYWVPRGWSKEGPIKTQSRIDVPNGRIERGRHAVAGVAWAPDIGIERVEVQVDDEPWAVCELGRAPSDDTWVQWHIEWDATPGTHSVRVRATDRTGATQTGERRPPAPDGATGWHTRRIVVT